MAKVDVKSAYHNVPIHPEDQWLMGMLWEGDLYINTVLPFGLHSAPKIFMAIADAVEWVVRQEGVHFVIHYLDDFLLIEAPSSQECVGALTTLLSVFERLGLPIAQDKKESPWSQLTFLGFELDSLALVIRLPLDKLVERQCLILSWVRQKSCTEGVGVAGGQTGTCQQSGSPRKDLHEAHVQAAERPATGTPLCETQHSLPIGPPMAGHVLEAWNGVAMMQSPGPGQLSHHV